MRERRRGLTVCPKEKRGVSHIWPTDRRPPAYSTTGRAKNLLSQMRRGKSAQKKRKRTCKKKFNCKSYLEISSYKRKGEKMNSRDIFDLCKELKEGKS